MHLRVGVLLAVGLAVAFASPAGRKTNNGEAEVMMVPLETPLYDMEDGDAGFPGGFFSFNPFHSLSGNPFSGFMQSMDDMLKNLRDQMTQVLHRLPPDNVDWKNVDGKGNTTSTVKVINGHKVTINETTYTNEGDNSGSVFKIRIVDVHPTSEEDTEDTSAEKVDNKPTAKPAVHKEVEETTPKSDNREETSPKFSESSNEIPQGDKEDGTEFNSDIESFDEVSNSDEWASYYQRLPETFNQQSLQTKPYGESIEEIDTNDVNFDNQVVRDLSDDILVNQMMADRGAPHNPDSESIYYNSYAEPYGSGVPYRSHHAI